VSIKELATQAEERLASLAAEHGVPGVACGIDLAGEAIGIACGITHAHHPLPVDGETLFQIASNSKPFTATLVMTLVAEGRLDLDDPVSKHLPAFRMPGRRFEADVTVRHLLTHRVGWDGDALFVRQPDPPELASALAPMEAAAQLVPPGTAWTYSNAGFTVAGRLVEVLTGQSFEQALGERILAPLGMGRTVTRADQAIFHRIAMRHLSGRDMDPVPLPGGGWQPGWELAPIDTPAGGLVSCADDLMRWLRFWLARDDEGPALLPDALRLEMQREQLDRYNPLNGQAIGWAIRHDPAARVLNHGGLTAGYCSLTLFAPELDLAAVILTNGTSGAPVHTRFSQWLVGAVGGAEWVDPVALSPQPDLARYAGSYRGSFGVHEARVADGALEISTRRHPTEDGSWQPPPEGALTAKLVSRDHAVIVTPEALRGSLLDFDPDPDAPAPSWLRTGGRIAVRQDT